MKKTVSIYYNDGQTIHSMRFPLGWVLLVALAFGLIVLAGPIATRWSGAGDAHGAYSAKEQEAIRAFRARPDYGMHVLGMKTTAAKVERKRQRDERYQRKLNARLKPELRAALGAK